MVILVKEKYMRSKTGNPDMFIYVYISISLFYSMIIPFV